MPPTHNTNTTKDLVAVVRWDAPCAPHARRSLAPCLAACEWAPLEVGGDDAKRRGGPRVAADNCVQGEARQKDEGVDRWYRAAVDSPSPRAQRHRDVGDDRVEQVEHNARLGEVAVQERVEA